MPAVGAAPEDLLRALHDLAPRDDHTVERIVRLLDSSWAPAGDEPSGRRIGDDVGRGSEPGVVAGAAVAPEPAAELAAKAPPAPGGIAVPPTLTPLEAGPGPAPAWLRVPASLPVSPAVAGQAPSPPPLLVREQARGILVAVLSAPQETRRLDVEAAVRAIARGGELLQLPFRRLRSVAPRVQLLLDRGEAMLPFGTDLRGLAEDAERLLGADGLEILRFAGCPIHGAGPGSRRTWSSTWAAHTPPPGTCVLVATDLGIGDPPASDPSEWLALAAAVARAGCRLVIFVPYGPARWPPELARQLELVHWDRSTTAGRAAAFVRGRARAGLALTAARRQPARDRAGDAERLAARCAFSAQVDPALLRVARLELLGDLDAGAEADVWVGPYVRFRSPQGLVFDPVAADRLRAALAAEDLMAYEAAWALTRRVHGHLPRAVRVHEELLYLHRSREPGALERIRELLRGTVATMVTRRDDLAGWAARLAAELPPDMSETEEGQMLRSAAHLRLPDRLVATPDLPEAELPDWLAWVAPDELSTVPVGLRLFDEALELTEPPAEGARVLRLPRTRPLAIEVAGRRVEIEPGTTAYVPVQGDAVIRTALGAEWALAPAPRASPFPSDADAVLLRLETHRPQGPFVQLFADDGSEDWLDRALASAPMIEEVGVTASPADLLRALLSGEVEPAFRELTRSAEAVLLDVRTPDLQAIMWELAATAPAGSRAGDLVWVRVHPRFRRWREPAKTEPGPLRVLLIDGRSAEDAGRGDAAAAAIRAASMRLTGGLDHEVLTRPTADHLFQVLDDFRPQVVHLVAGHDTFSAGVMMTSGDGERWLLEATMLSLATAPEPVVVLDLGPTRLAVASPFADAVLSTGVGAVVTIAGLEDPAPYAALNEVLYDRLPQGMTIDRAVTDARLRITSESGSAEARWVPVLTVAEPPASLLPTPDVVVDPEQAERIAYDLVGGWRTAFVDRVADIRRLMRWLMPDSSLDTGLIAVSGPPAVGKSLLVRWCLARRALAGANVAYVDLGPAGRADPSALPAAIADALEASPVHGDHNAEALAPVRRQAKEEPDAQVRVLRVFESALRDIAQWSPAVIALDGVRHAGAGSWPGRDLTEAFARNLVPGRLVLVLNDVQYADLLSGLTTQRLAVAPFPPEQFAACMGDYLRALGIAAGPAERLVAAVGADIRAPWLPEMLERTADMARGLKPEA